MASNDVYTRLGVRPIINAQGHRTVVGGSTLSPPVVEAMEQAGESFVEMRELLERSGEYIADRLGVEAACVTSGGFAALYLSAAACIAGSDPEKIKRLPDTSGMRRRFLLQKKQHYTYDRAYSACGGELVLVGDDDGCTLDELEQAIGPDTAAIAYLVKPEPDDSVVSLEDAVALAHSHGLPAIADAAAQNYPLDYFLRNAQSADLACFGAKYLGAPHSTGFVCGTKEMVDGAVAHGFIAFQHDGGNAIGRGFKVDRQEVIGVVAAVDGWLSMNHEDRILGYDAKLSKVERALEHVAHVSTGVVQNPNYWQIGLHVTLDTAALGKSAERVAQEMDEGSPRVWVNVEGKDTVVVNAHALYDGDEEVVAERLAHVLGG